MMSRAPAVAIVDDDTIYQFTAKKLIQLTELAGEITQFSSGEEALEYITQNSSDAEKLPDVLLLDLNMPIVDGWMFLKSFQQTKSLLSKPIKIYMVTSSIDPRDMAQSKLFPDVKGFICKPLDLETVNFILNSVM